MNLSVKPAADFAELGGIGQRLNQIIAIVGPDFILNASAIAFESYNLNPDLMKRAVQEPHLSSLFNCAASKRSVDHRAGKRASIYSAVP